MAIYIYGEMNTTFPANWNVLVYHRYDWLTQIYMTGLWDAYHPGKRYFQTIEPNDTYSCILILETNSTTTATN